MGSLEYLGGPGQRGRDKVLLDVADLIIVCVS